MNLFSPPAALYADTIRLLLPASTTAAQAEHWRQRLRGHIRAGMIGGFFLGDDRRRNGQRDLHLHRPSEKMIPTVARWAKQQHVVLFGVDIATDFFAPSLAENDRLRDTLDLHVILRGRRVFAPVTIFRGTRYLEDRRAGRNLVIYSDRRSKIDGRPCVHVELRLRGSRALRRAGLAEKQVDSWPTFFGQKNLCCVFERAVHLIEFDAEKIGASLVALGNARIEKTDRFSSLRKIGFTAGRFMMGELRDENVTAVVWLATCKKWRLKPAKHGQPLIALCLRPRSPP